MKTLHLVVTPLCNRHCPYCCNKKYDIQNLPVAHDEDFKWAEMLCLTGGEPFEYSNPCNIGLYFKLKYPHLKIVAYSNAYELFKYLKRTRDLCGLDGINISCKTQEDVDIFNEKLSRCRSLTYLPMNRVYDFVGTISPYYCKPFVDNFDYIKREWQEDFKPAPDSRFMRI